MKNFINVVWLMLLMCCAGWCQSPTPTPDRDSDVIQKEPALKTSPTATVSPQAPSSPVPSPAPTTRATSIPAVDEAAASVPTETAAETPTPDSEQVFLSPLTRRALFTVAGAGSYSAEERAFLISRRLERLLEEHAGKEAPSVTTEARKNDFVIKVGDDLLVTVLPEDAAALNPHQEITPAVMMATAESWRAQLEEDIAEGWKIRSPFYKWKALAFLAFIFLLFLFVHLKLDNPVTKRTAVPTTLLRVALWSFYLVIALWSFPTSRRWAIAVYMQGFKPLIWIVAIIIVTSLVINAYEHVVVWYFDTLLQDGLHTGRRFRRLTTLRQVLVVTGRVLISLLAFILILSALPVNYAPLLASASVLGVAFGFAAQDILKDLFGGITILLEDRFGVGDWIEWNGHTGEVEAFNLKSTSLRSTDGSLLLVPNADLRLVRNLSNQWSQVDYRVGISYEDDFEHALRCLLEVGQQLAKDWPDRIVAPPELKGVQSLDESQVTIGIYLRTKPLEQWGVNREMNGRVKARFDKEGISIPYAQRTVWVKNETEVQKKEASDDSESSTSQPFDE